MTFIKYILLVGALKFSYSCSAQIKVESYFVDTNLNRCDSVYAKYRIFKTTDTVTDKGKFMQVTLNDFIVSEAEYLSMKYEIREGVTSTYFLNGQLKSKINYKTGLYDGVLETYYDNGKIKRSDVYKAGDYISGKCFTREGNDTTHYEYDIPTKLIYKKNKSFIDFIADNLKYPREAINNNISGIVIIEFDISAIGEMRDLHINKSVHSSLDKEALRVVGLMKNWKPAYIDGEPVNMQLKLPVTFTMAGF